MNRTGIQQLEAKADRMEDALEQIKTWCEAYPLAVFPEPDFKRAAKLLEDGGMTLDTISASNMRHVLRGIVHLVEQGLGT